MPGAFTLNGKVQQVTKDGTDGGIDQDKTVATGWTATLRSNYPKGVALPDGSDIDYIDERTIVLLSDGSISEDGATAGISLSAHDPAIFATPLQWTIKPGTVTLTSGRTLRPKAWTFNAPVDGVSTTLGALTTVAAVTLQAVSSTIPWGSVTGVPTALSTGPNAANGYAGLDSSGKLNTAQLPISAMEYKGNWNASTNSPTLADGTGSAGDVYKVTTGAARNLGSGSITWDVGDYVIYNGTTWEKSDNTDAVASVAGRTGTVVLVKADVGLSNADNTSDVNKPVSTAQQTALDLKPAGAVYATMAALKAATVSTTGFARVQGYYTAGDGGGGFFRWDSTDTTSTDNGGTIITPTTLTPGRWKRVYEGELNARWFGVNPSQTDNTAALQAAVNWVSTTFPCAGVFIPSGQYPFKFTAGTSGLSTITIAADNVSIRGEGKSTQLKVTNNARPSQVGYFFTFSWGGNLRGNGGGVSNLNFYGNSMLKWCILLETWRDAEFHNISAFDVHSGILDAVATSTTLYGESISVHHLDTATTAGTSLTQYGVRFRAGSGGSSKTWSDSWIENSLFVSCWDTGVVLDAVQRIHVRGTAAGNNGTYTDTVDGTSKSGCLHAVRITNGTTGSVGATGGHQIDGVYLESQSGSETVATNVAVQIDVPSGQNNQNRFSRVSNVTVNGTCGLVKFVDDNALGRANNNEFTNRIVSTITSSATPAINVNEVRHLIVTALTTAITSMTSGLTGTPSDGDRLMTSITGTAARAITWGASFEAGPVALPTTTVTTQRLDVGFIWNAATSKWRCMASGSA